MADPIYIAKLRLPLNEKPETEWNAQNSATYKDIFSLQNTIRIVIANFVEEAPLNGSDYVRNNGEWVISAGGGGGGGIPDAPADNKLYGRKNYNWVEVPSGGGGTSTACNLYLTGNQIGVDNNYRGYTILAKLPHNTLINKSSNWRFTMALQATAPFMIGAITVRKTLPGSSAVIGSPHVVTVGGSATPSIVPPGSSVFRVTTDPITIQLDGVHDFWVSVYFNAANAVNNNVGTMEATTYVKSGYILGDYTNSVTIPSVSMNTYLITSVQEAT